MTLADVSGSFSVIVDWLSQDWRVCNELGLSVFFKDGQIERVSSLTKRM